MNDSSDATEPSLNAKEEVLRKIEAVIAEGEALRKHYNDKKAQGTLKEMIPFLEE